MASEESCLKTNDKISKVIPNLMFKVSLKGVFAKNERWYRLNALKKALLIATNLTSICCVFKSIVLLVQMNVRII